MIDFSLSGEERAVRDTIRQFIEQEVMPLEPQVLRNERNGLPPLEGGQLKELQAKARARGWWGINTPEEYGGIALGPVMSAIVAMEAGRTFVPFGFGGSADNILYAGNAEQKREYLIPTINGDRRSCFAITEPGAGSDARNIKTRAVKDGDDWVINGEKTFITGGNEADFVMVFAVTDPAKGADGGVTCFLVDRDMGWKSDPIPTMGEWGPASLVFEDVRVPERNILGQVGNGFTLAMQWIGNGRFMIPARAIGSAERLLGMAIEHAKNRVSMGHPIAEYQAIQWQIADSHVEIESVKWLTLHAAWQLHTWLQSATALLFGQADRIFAGVMLGAEALSAYALCVQLAQPIYGLTAAGLHFLFPHLASRCTSGSTSAERHFILRALAVNIGFVLTALAVLIIFGRAILLIWGGPLIASAAGSLLPAIACSAALSALGVTGCYALLALGKPRVVTSINLTGGLTMILLFPLLIRHFGLAGIVYGRLIFAPTVLLVYIPLFATIRSQDVQQSSAHLFSTYEGI